MAISGIGYQPVCAPVDTSGRLKSGKSGGSQQTTPVLFSSGATPTGASTTGAPRTTPVDIQNNVFGIIGRANGNLGKIEQDIIAYIATFPTPETKAIAQATILKMSVTDAVGSAENQRQERFSVCNAVLSSMGLQKPLPTAPNVAFQKQAELVQRRLEKEDLSIEKVIINGGRTSPRDQFRIHPEYATRVLNQITANLYGTEQFGKVGTHGPCTGSRATIQVFRDGAYEIHPTRLGVADTLAYGYYNNGYNSAANADNRCQWCEATYVNGTASPSSIVHFNCATNVWSKHANGLSEYEEINQHGREMKTKYDGNKWAYAYGDNELSRQVLTSDRINEMSPTFGWNADGVQAIMNEINKIDNPRRRAYFIAYVIHCAAKDTGTCEEAMAAAANCINEDNIYMVNYFLENCFDKLETSSIGESYLERVYREELVPRYYNNTFTYISNTWKARTNSNSTGPMQQPNFLI